MLDGLRMHDIKRKHLRLAGSEPAAQQPQPKMAASPTRPSVFMAMPPEDTPAATRPASQAWVLTMLLNPMLSTKMHIEVLYDTAPTGFSPCASMQTAPTVSNEKSASSSAAPGTVKGMSAEFGTSPAVFCRFCAGLVALHAVCR